MKSMCSTWSEPASLGPIWCVEMDTNQNRDLRTETLLSQLDAIESTVARPRSRLLRLPAASFAFVSFVTLAISVRGQLLHPLMIAFLVVTALGMIVPMLLRRRAEGRIMRLLQKHAEMGRVLDDVR